VGEGKDFLWAMNTCAGIKSKTLIYNILSANYP